MKKRLAIFLLILTVISIFALTLTACNDEDKLVATFEFDENDGMENFVLRRGIFVNYIISELRKIDSGISASWKENDNGTMQIEVSNVRTYSNRVREIIYGKPQLQFKTIKSASETTSFLGNNNIQSIACAYDRKSIQITFTASGVKAVNNYHAVPLHIYLGDDYILTMTSQFILTESNSTVIVNISNNVYPTLTETLVAQLNVGAFGLKIKNLSIK